MAYTRRQWKGNAQALLHFDYAYPGEPNDGLRDEIGIETWSRVGSPKWVGVEAPVDQVVVGAPLFGWRCPQFSGAACYIKGANSQNIWNLSSDGKYEVEFFARFTDATASNIFALRNVSGDLLALAKNTSNQITLTSGFWGVNKVSVKALKVGFWHHLVIRVRDNAIKVYLDGEEILTNVLPTGEVLDVTETRLGGYVGQMDEFVLRHSAKMSTPVVPTEPHNAYVDMRLLGGAGNGAFGDITLSSGTQQINAYGMITSVADGTDVSVNTNQSLGIYGGFDRGHEVLIHVSAKKATGESELGKYALRRVINVRSNVLVLDKPITDEFMLDNALLSNYHVQIITVPNFLNFTVNGGATVVPAQWDIKSGGGIIAFKCKQNLTLDGKLLSSGYMPGRSDSIPVSHSTLVNRFIIGGGGGVFIVVGNKCSASINSRIGAAHSGDLPAGDGGKGGALGTVVGSIPYPGSVLGKKGDDGTPGGSGCGGGGGGGSAGNIASFHSDPYRSGAPGGAAENGKLIYGGKSGYGGGKWSGATGSAGPVVSGFQGASPGKDGIGSSSNASSGYSGSSVLVFAKKGLVETASISTGGCAGSGGAVLGSTASSGYASGAPGTSGGGTGFAYIATRRDV